MARSTIEEAKTKKQKYAIGFILLRREQDYEAFPRIQTLSDLMTRNSGKHIQPIFAYTKPLAARLAAHCMVSISDS